MEEPSRQFTRQGVVVGRERKSAETRDLSDTLEEWATLQRDGNPRNNDGFSETQLVQICTPKLWEIIHTVQLRGNNG